MWFTREIDAPAADAWRLLTDTEAWPRWGPTISGVEDAPRSVRLGSTGRVRTSIGLALPFEVTVFVPGREWRWRVAGVPATGHRVEEVDERRCRVGFDVPLPALPYALVCELALRRIAAELERAGTPTG